MLKKITAFLIALAVQVTGLSYAAGASSTLHNRVDTRVLRGIGIELKEAGTSRALVETSSGVMGVDTADLTGAWIEGGQVWISYYSDGTLLKGRYMEPDLVRHFEANGSNLSPDEMDASEAGEAMGLDRLRELVEGIDGTVTVAVIDTGVDLRHPWLQGRTVFPYDAAEDDYEPQDLFGHGTHIAGIIARNTPSNVRIMPVRVFNKDGDAPDSLIVKGIYHAVRNGADIINMSLGGYGTTAYLDKAIDYAVSRGVMVIASAGNEAKDNSHYYPAAFPEVMTVGATGINGDLLYFSNTGDPVDVCAPGEKIVSALPGDSTGSKSGTSMAASLVASAAAMLILEDPSRSISDLEEIIFGHTCDLGVPGKDKLFGYGQLTFKNYKSNPDFYMIESREEENLEEKYHLNLGFYAGESVKTVEVRIDGAYFRQIHVTTPGTVKVSLDIRGLDTGAHQLEVLPVFTDGTLGEAFRRDFIVPDYNVRVRVYDADGKPVTNPRINVMGFSAKDMRITKLDMNPVISNGVCMVNLDFELLSRRYDKIRLSVESLPDDGPRDVPFYLRTIGTTGEKVFEPSECNVLGLTSRERISGCTVTTRILGNSLLGFSDVRQWGGSAYEAVVSAKDISFVEIEDDDGSLIYAGLLYYDVADLWIDIYSYSEGQRKDPSKGAGIWYHSGKLENINSIMRLDSSNLKTINVEADLSGVDKAEFMLLNIPTGNTVTNVLNGSSGSVNVMTGFFDIFLLAERSLKGGGIASDAFFNTFHTEFRGKTKNFRFGDGLVDDFIYDTASKRILHRWTDIHGNGYSVMVLENGRTDLCIPVLSLVDVRGSSYRLQGAESVDTGDYIHAYSLEKMPDGVYRLSFVNDDAKLAFPVKPATSLVTILNGTAYIPGNTPPVAYSNYTSDIRPGDLFVFDLHEEFSDREQAELKFSATAGWIVDGLFFYRDLIGQDAEIVITAYDGAGGVTSFRHTIRVTDRNAPESDYIPIPDIDSIGASSWAVPYVQKAIEANIVPVELLDAYQAGITRAEFSSMIVRMAESFLGEIIPAPGISFLDTEDPDVLKAASMKFLTGYNGIFSPNEFISRQQLCVIIYQAVKVLRPDLAVSVPVMPQFNDASQIAPWAREAVSFCNANDIIVGSGGIMNPTGTLTREQAIITIYKTFVLCRQGKSQGSMPDLENDAVLSALPSLLLINQWLALH